MKVVLGSDVKNVGKVGDLVSVSKGFARNFLFPRKLAFEATERKIKEFKHLQLMADIRKKKVLASRQELLNQISGLTLVFKKQAGEKTDKLFGSVTSAEIAAELEKNNVEIDRRDIVLEDSIKVLGQHKAKVRFGEGLETEIAISVERE
jgi:large subunit ribosomal protein L9